MRHLFLLAVALGCSHDCIRADATRLNDSHRPECVVRLPAEQFSGVPWPTFTEQLSKVSACENIFQYSEAECADGKRRLSFDTASLYFSGDTVVGREIPSDIPPQDCSGCSYHPEGDTTCEVVSYRVVNCVDAGPQNRR